MTKVAPQSPQAPMVVTAFRRKWTRGLLSFCMMPATKNWPKPMRLEKAMKPFGQDFLDSDPEQRLPRCSQVQDETP